MDDRSADVGSGRLEESVSLPEGAGVGTSGPKEASLVSIPRTWLARLVGVFWNHEERRLRALWRLQGHALVALVGLLIVLVPILGALLIADHLAPLPTSRLASLSGTGASGVGEVTSLKGVMTILQGGVMTAATWAARRLFDRRSFASLGLRREGFVVRDLVFGIVLAGAMMATSFAIMLACGWLRVHGLAWESTSVLRIALSLGGFALLFVGVGWYEELVSRGYWYVNLRDGVGVRTAVIVSSCVFALGHVGNPNATLVSTAALIGAGLFLAWAVLRTGQLWMSVGIHFGWNFFEGPIFGFPVSGMDTFALIRHDATGPPSLTGGAFGPEAGILLLAIQCVGAVAIWWVTRGRVVGESGNSTV
jgi:membrane protease YdiL (CAAX protease family)